MTPPPAAEVGLATLIKLAKLRTGKKRLRERIAELEQAALYRPPDDGGPAYREAMADFAGLLPSREADPQEEEEVEAQADEEEERPTGHAALAKR